MAQWYCRVGGQQYGPITEEALRQWLREGRVGSSDLVWSEGMAQWLPASQVPGLTVAGAVPPGPPVQAVRPHRGAMVLVFGRMILQPGQNKVVELGTRPISLPVSLSGSTEGVGNLYLPSARTSLKRVQTPHLSPVN